MSITVHNATATIPSTPVTSPAIAIPRPPWPCLDLLMPMIPHTMPAIINGMPRYPSTGTRPAHSPMSPQISAAMATPGVADPDPGAGAYIEYPPYWGAKLPGGGGGGVP